MRAGAFMFILLWALALPGALAQSTQPTHKPGGFHSPEIHPGETWELAFPVAPRTAYYHCHPHPFMQGIIDVKEGASRSGRVLIEIRNYEFPDRLDVQPNTTVIWVNKDEVVHTIDESVPPATTAPPPGGADSPAAPFAWSILAAVAALAAARRK